MPDDPLAEVLEIVTTLARKTAKGGYIFRGEPKRYEQVTSRLYRELPAGVAATGPIPAKAGRPGKGRVSCRFCP